MVVIVFFSWVATVCNELVECLSVAQVILYRHVFLVLRGIAERSQFKLGYRWITSSLVDAKSVRDNGRSHCDRH